MHGACGRHRRRAGLSALVVAGAATLALMASAAPGAALDASWPTYHLDGRRSGNDTAGPSLNPATPAWTAGPLDGSIYAEPVVAGGRVVVATENGSLYGLEAATGHILWRRNLAPPVADITKIAGCGNIVPLGITGTPVIDQGTGTVFAVTETPGGPAGVQHLLFGVDLGSGAIKMQRNVDPPGMASPPAQQERGALALANGFVYVPFGGLAGDCGDFRGFLVGSAEDGSGPLLSWQTAGRGGGAWTPPGASVDADGRVYLATGNGFSTTTYDFTDSVVRLSPTLQLEGFFQSPTWASDNGSDNDLGSTGPELLGNGLGFQVGKQGTAYLFRTAPDAASHLGLAFSGNACAAFGGDAWAPPILYVPCSSGVKALRVDLNAPSFSQVWQTSTAANGPPIVAGGLVWSVNTGTAVLHGLDPATGNDVVHFSLGSVNHFTTPTAALGLVIVGAGAKVAAFQGPGGPPPPLSTQGYWAAARDGGVFSFGTAPFFGSAGNIRLNQPIVAMAPTPGHHGYWLVAADGGIFTYGDAGFFGSTGNIRLNRPIVGMAATPTGRGYWLVASDGGIFAFGDAPFFGSTGAIALNRPIVGMAARAQGDGYWLVASDGGVFAFGGAPFAGSTGNTALKRPVTGVAATPSGLGYWMVASDGGIFAFGDAPFLGSTGAITLFRPVVGMAAHGSGAGYWMVASDGGIFAFGDAQFAGSTGGTVLNQPVVGMAAAV